MKRVQFPQDFFCTQTWPPIHCFVHKYGCRDVMWKRSIVSTVREKGWRIGESWWEHSPPTNVAWVLIMTSTTHVFHMWVEFVVGSLLCSERLFSGYSDFPPSLNQHFQIPNRSGTHGHVSTSSYKYLSAPWLNKLQFLIFTITAMIKHFK